MRFVRAGAGALLLTLALPMGVVGALVANDGGRRDPGGPYRMTVEIAGLPSWLGWLLLGAAAGLTLLVIWLAVRPGRSPVPPREVVLVVEPAQVPLLAERLGLETLDRIGRSAREALAAAGGPTGTTGPGPAVEPVGGTDGQPAGRTMVARPGPVRPPVPLRLAWPTARPPQEGRPVSHPPVPASKAGRRGATAGAGVPEREAGRRRSGIRATGKHLRDRP